MRLSAIAGLAGLLLVLGCTNNPYPDADQDQKVLYSSFNEAPKTLDPAVAYTTAEHVVTGTVYDTLLEYHYLKRPYELIAGLAEAVPEARDAGGRPPGLSLQAAPRRAVPCRSLLCAEPARPRHARGRGGRRGLPTGAPRRPRRQQPRRQHVRRRAGLHRFRQAARRTAQGRPGIRRRCPRRSSTSAPAASKASSCAATMDLEIVLAGPNPQILYWFAMPFTTPMPWEAVAYYDGKDGRAQLRRSRRRHGRVPACGVRAAAPLRAGAQPELVRHAAARSQGARRDLPNARSTPRTSTPAASTPAYAGRPHAVPRPHQLLARARGHPALQQVPAGLLRRRRHHQGELRRHHQGRPAVAGDGGARHAPRQGGGADHLLHRLQHGRPGDRARSRRDGPQAAPGHEPGRRRAKTTCGCSSTAAACRRNRRCRRDSSATPRTTGTRSASPTWRARARCWPRPATRTASIPPPDSR